jgi:hypothetical protein
MAYYLMLTDREVADLGWFADRGYFPKEIYDAMFLADGEPEEGDYGERKWEFEEHIAWSLLELRDDDPDAYLSCMGGTLLEKIVALEGQIV